MGFCDIDEYCFKVLEKNFPGVPHFNDIKKLKGKHLGKIDMICGGFPCQDISQAGKGLGIEKGKRSSLWSEFHRLIGELRPRFTIIENVSAITNRGLNIVLRDLAEIGYDAEWQCIGAYQIGARHRRDRIWIVAYPNTNSGRCIRGGFEEQSDIRGVDALSKSTKICETISNSSSIRPRREETNKELAGGFRPTICSVNDRDEWGKSSIFKSRLGRVAYGLPNWIYKYWEEEPNGIPRADKSKKNRKDRLMALGNSIVPQIPMLIMKRIKEIIEQED